MNRKQTILLAIFMNGALLVVLFLSALSSPEEIAIPPTHETAKPSLPTREEPPLFIEEAPMAPVAVPQPAPAKTEPEAPVVHSLPPVAAAESAAPPAPPAATGASVSGLQVTVKKGDSLEKIAKVHHTTVDEILKLNHLPSSFLRVGQVLKIPEPSAKPKIAEKSAVPTSGPEYYVVKVGDNPWTIAMKHHLKVEELLKLNGLNEEKARKLKPGDRLRIK